MPNVRYLYPVVEYDTDTKGVPISKSVTVKVLALGKDAYDALTTVHDLKGSLTQFDFVVNCTDDQYQKVSFTEAGAARWCRVPENLKLVQEFLENNAKFLTAAIGREVSDEILLKSVGVDSSPTIGAANMDDVFAVPK